MTLSLITLPFGLSFADIPAACRGLRPPLGEVCTAQPRRAASSSRKRRSPLMSHSPRAPLEPARCVQRPRLSPPLFAATQRLSEPASPLPPLLWSHSLIFSAQRCPAPFPPPNCCCNGFPFLPPFRCSPPPLLGFRAVGT